MNPVMKKIALLLCAALALFACRKADPEVPETEDAGKQSDLEFFQDGLVRLDDRGNIAGYNIGENLNEADPSEVSYPVDSYQEALGVFLSWLPDGAQPAVSGKTYTWEMTDEENKSEGQVVFSDSAEPGVLAAVSVNAANAKVRTVKFIPTTAWPKNSSSMEEYLADYYFLGATVFLEKDLGYGKGEFVVIREWSPQENGLMIQMEGKVYHQYTDDYNTGKASSVNTTQTVSKVLHQGSNYEYIVNTYGKSKGWPSLDERYITSKVKRPWDSGTRHYFVNLESGKEGKFSNSLFKNNSWYRVFIYWFKPEGDKIIYW